MNVPYCIVVRVRFLCNFLDTGIQHNTLSTIRCDILYKSVNLLIQIWDFKWHIYDIHNSCVVPRVSYIIHYISMKRIMMIAIEMNIWMWERVGKWHSQVNLCILLSLSLSLAFGSQRFRFKILYNAINTGALAHIVLLECAADSVPKPFKCAIWAPTKCSSIHLR